MSSQLNSGRRVLGEQFGEGGFGGGHVDLQQLVVIGRVELAHRLDLAADQPGQPAGIKIAAGKGFVAEMRDQRRKKARIGALVGVPDGRWKRSRW